MKLNADIVYAALRERYTVRMTGPKTKELTLSRPELYLDNQVEFLSDHLYLATVDHLPLRPRLQKNAVIIVIGDGAKLAHYRNACCLIVIRDKVDFFAVNKVLWDIFDCYYAWEKRLFDIFLDTADLQEIVECSASVFRRPIHVLDASFHFLAHSGDGAAPFSFQSSSGKLNLESISEYLSSFELITEKRGAILIDPNDLQFMCVNLFDQGGDYIGCVYIEGLGRPFQEGDGALAEYMAHLIEKAIEKAPAVLSSELDTIKRSIFNLVNEYPLSPSQKWKLNLSNHDHNFVCISLHSASQISRLPERYICSSFESEFPSGFAFTKDASTVCFLDVDVLSDQSGNYHTELNKRLKIFLDHSCCIAGISNSFLELYNARIAYIQAEAAIENGMITNPESNLFYFQSSALMSMVINSIGDLPAEAYFSERLRKLIEHDKTAAVSYIETLRVFLQNSLSYTQTAKELFIHRSTIVDRIARIQRELEIDLKDPDTRLQLEIILKAMEIEDMVQMAKD